MLIIPAIDLKDGKVVRLYQGKKEDEKVYSRNPAVVARHWQKQGAQLIHVVDLDGAFGGEPGNLPSLKKIISAVNVPIEFGGGVRNKETIRAILGLGVQRIVLGTKAVQDESFLKEVFAEFKEKIIVSIDTKDDLVLTEGWESEKSDYKTIDFALKLQDLGFSQIIYTDTSKDGTLRGPNLEGIRSILSNTDLTVIASGGISSLEDIVKLKQLGKKRMIGVIVGKALYEEKFTLKEAIRLK
jgi:phosphoribosylformimino-5-aminoimidazole carboxamide ribotide isomerase